MVKTPQSFGHSECNRVNCIDCPGQYLFSYFFLQIRMDQKLLPVCTLVIAIVVTLRPVSGSLGDRSYVFSKCHDKCVKSNCTGAAALKSFR